MGEHVVDQQTHAKLHGREDSVYLRSQALQCVYNICLCNKGLVPEPRWCEAVVMGGWYEGFKWRKLSDSWH
jgi:hypothetical protein